MARSPASKAGQCLSATRIAASGEGEGEDGWKIGKKTEAKRVLLNKNSCDCRGCINPGCTNYIWFPNFKNWFCLRGRDHPFRNQQLFRHKPVKVAPSVHHSERFQLRLLMRTDPVFVRMKEKMHQCLKKSHDIPSLHSVHSAMPLQTAYYAWIYLVAMFPKKCCTIFFTCCCFFKTNNHRFKEKPKISPPLHHA